MSFQKRLQAHEFVVLAEMHTPKGVNISRLMTDARRIKGRIDAVVIPDMDNGIMRMSAIAGGVLMQQQGVEAIIHTYCRDRNRMALQGDILAAHVLGIQNLIVAHSEEMSQGDHSDAKTVADLDEIGLLGAIRQLQAGRDMAGFDLDGIPGFTVGCTMAPCADAASSPRRSSISATSPHCCRRSRSSGSRSFPPSSSSSRWPSPSTSPTANPGPIFPMSSSAASGSRRTANRKGSRSPARPWRP